MSVDSKAVEKVRIFIQVRISSSRLPGKALLPINGKTILHRLIERLKKSIDSNIIISTSINPADQKIVEEAKKLKVDYFTGDENDSLDRFVKTAHHYPSEAVVRVTGDNPFTDPFHIDRVVSYLLDNTVDYVGMTGLPLGTGAEVIRVKALEKTLQLTSQKQHREHITSFIYRNPDLFTVAFLSPSEEVLNRPEIRLTMDTQEDFELIQRIYTHLGDYPSIQSIIHLLDSSPELLQINSHIQQKTYDYST